MAGKSSKGKNRKGAHGNLNSAEIASPSDANTLNDEANPSESSNIEANMNKPGNEALSTQSDTKQSEDANEENQAKLGEVRLYPISVKTQGGGKLELHLSPGDSVMDVKQFLLDAPQTCFFTCYDLLLHAKDGSIHKLRDYSEISEVADITTGDCSLEMVAAFYDDKSMRVHVQRTQDLLSLSTMHSSLSTSLALQHESGKSTASSGDSKKADVSELDNVGFIDDVTDSITTLLLIPSKEIKCVESIVFSSFNPPPSYRRLVGDLIYLDLISLEGSKFCITGTTRTFYVNSSTENILNPRPSKVTFEAETLIGLLQKISPKFKKAFNDVLEQKASAHPFENCQSLLSPNPWLGVYPIPDHTRDASRAETALSLSFGSELIGMQRDWNEEVQSCREFPHTTPQERILRDRALYKVTSDFVDAATSGAIGVINKCIPPINPTDPECFHMYVHNNIFFSFAVDSDLEKLSRKHIPDINSDVGNTIEKTSSNFSLGAVKVSSGAKSDGPSSESQDGALCASSNVPVDSDTQLAESEQATYASSNNDLKGTKAYQGADVPGLYNLAMAIIDYRGHRMVAQSVLPGILQGDKSDSLLYGSVDNGKKICWNEDFHSKILEAAKHLHLKEHFVVDGSGKMFKLAAPVESKGIVGSDDRHYLLDLMRITPRDANYTGPGSKFCVLRPELISAFFQAEAEKLKNAGKMEEAISGTIDSPKDDNAEEILDMKTWVEVTPDISETQDDSKEEKLETAQECTDVSEPVGNRELCEQISFNPNVFTDFKLAGSEKEIVADEENVKKVSIYLRDIVLPKFIEELCTLEVSPMDGLTLTEALHAHGINVRYIGKVAEGTKHFPHLWDLCSNEIVVRSAKHILKDLLRETQDHDIAPAISHLFNCFFGNSQAPVKESSNYTPSKSSKKGHFSTAPTDKSPKVKTKSKNGASAKRKQSSSLDVTSDSLWTNIAEFAKAKYQFMLPEDARSRVKKIHVLRNLCQKVGVTVAARKYDLDSATPFQTSDILNLQPVVKHSIPLSSEAKDLVETGKVQLAEGMLSEAYTLFSEAFTTLQQVTGPMHHEVANCCRYLALVLYHAGDMAGAIMQQHKELIINERCLGLDHPDTAHSYGNMALFYHGLNQTDLALCHMARALLLSSLSSGPDHPDVAATFINVAMMYQDMGKMNTALRYLQEALTKNMRLLGEEHIQTAVCYHALAIACNCMGAFKLSHQHEKKTYDILVKRLGEEDSRTRDAQNWMNTFKMRELQMNAQKQKGQALDAASAQKAIDLLRAHPDLIQAFQSAAASGGTGNSGLINESLSRGRGGDERAARAAAEMRKKAAARGLLVRPQGVPVQALPPLTQFLNIINSGVTNDSTKSNNPESSAHVSSEGVVVEQQNPVGLGLGLGSIDSKKLKSKSKVAA